MGRLSDKMTIFAHSLDWFWRMQTKLKGANPANGIEPNFPPVQKFLSDSNNNKWWGVHNIKKA